MTSTVDGREKAKIGLERAAALRLKNNRLGMTIFQASWIMVFLAIIVVNWQLRYSYAQWPPEGVEPFDPLLPSVATLALLCSGWLFRGGRRDLRSGMLDGFVMRWRLGMGLGLAFMALIAWEFITVSEAALATQYGVTLRLMTGFHVAHALAILLVMLRVYRNGGRGEYVGGDERAWAVEGSAKLWYFVVLAWILFYVVLYWIR